MNLTKDNILIQLNKLILDSCLILNEQNEILKKSNPYTTQRKGDVDQGLVKLGGVFIKLEDVKHRILFESLEIQTIDIFVNLAMSIMKNIDSSLCQFSLRTLEEISFHKLQILFSDKLPKEEKDKYKAICMLADYGFMKGYADDYKKLFEEFRNLFSDKQIMVLRQLHESVNLETERQDLIKKIRKLISSIEDTLLKRTVLNPMFTQGRITAINSSFSHILHGDIFLLRDILNPKRRKSHELRTLSVIMYCMVNAINCVSKQIQTGIISDKIKTINSDYITLGSFTSNYWKKVGED